MNENPYSRSELIRLQKLPYEAKLILTRARIRQFYAMCKSKVYVAFSGGKDSTVLLHITRSIYPDVKAVFCDTGLEFPEIRDFVKKFDNVEIIKPEKTFKTIIEEQGYPIHSKEVAQAVDRYRRGLFTGIQRFTVKDGSRFDYSRYAFLLDAPFKISPKCCDEMKKKPFHKFEKKSGLRPIIGTMAEESYLRTMVWQIHGCINSTKGNEKASPLSFWNESDIYEYVQKNKIELAKPYAMGYKRTGCVFCLFGIQNDSYPNRIQRLQRTHPKLYDYCMSKRGLNMSPVLDFINVESRDRNKRIEDFYESPSIQVKGE